MKVFQIKMFLLLILLADINLVVAQKKFPPRKDELLSKVRPLSAGIELQSFLKDLKRTIASGMSAKQIAAVADRIQLVSGNTEAIGVIAVLSWYDGAYKDALLMGTEACIKDPSDHLMLNNLSALLNLSGSEHRALPILKMLQVYHPKNAMVLNNIGQAYTGLGELDSAMKYFKYCIEEVPNHPEANNTAGEIETSRGNLDKAAEHFNQSANGGFTESSMKRMEDDSQTAREYGNLVSRFVRPRVKLPDIFNAYKYKPVRQIRNVDEAKTLTEEHLQFEDFLHNVLNMYADLIQKEEDAGHNLINNPISYSGGRGKYFSPFTVPGGNIYARLAHSYALRKADLAAYRKEREGEIYELQLLMEQQKLKNLEEYEKCLQETNCKNCNPVEICNRTSLYPLNNKAANDFLSKAADIREEIQLKELSLAKETFENLAYFGFLAGVNKHFAKANFYKACYDYASAILHADETAYVARAGEEGQLFEPEPGGSDAPADMSCPINLKFDWGYAKFELNCENFKIGAFGGVVKGSRNSKTKQSTLQIGAEMSKEFDKKVIDIKSTGKISLEQSFYVTIDADGSFVDAGIAFDAKAGVNISSGISTSNETIQKVSPGTKGEENIFGYTLGVNSGWTFKEGVVTGIIDAAIGIN